MTKIKIYGDPILEKKCEDVIKVDKTIQNELDYMATVMFRNNGMGIAANQVGLDRNMFVMYNFSKKKINAFINPKLLYASEWKTEQLEGCLSMPDFAVSIARSTDITISFTDYRGMNRTVRFSNLAARCILHEMEHLSGKYMLDNLDEQTREKIIREKPWTINQLAIQK